MRPALALAGLVRCAHDVEQGRRNEARQRVREDAPGRPVVVHRTDLEVGSQHPEPALDAGEADVVHADPWNDGAIGMRPDRRRFTAMDCGPDGRAASCRCLVRVPRMAQDEHAVRCGPMFG